MLPTFPHVSTSFLLPRPNGPPTRPALIICPTETSPSTLPVIMSRVDLDSITLGVGAALAMGMECPPDDVETMALCATNSAQYVVAFFAATSRGWAVLPINPGCTKDEATSALENATLLVCEEGVSLPALQAAKDMNVPTFSIQKNFMLKEHHKPANSRRPHRGQLHEESFPENTALYLSTSGTTGKGKLVGLSHRNMCQTITNIINTYDLSPEDTSYLVMPLFHIHGLQAGLLAPLAAGGTVVLPGAGKFSASTFWRDVVNPAHPATYYTAVPTIHSILLQRAVQDRDLIKQHRLRFVRSCSSPLPRTTLEKYEAVVGVTMLEAYAMTEAAHQMTSNPLPKNGPRKPGSVGRATNVQLCIMDEVNRVAFHEAGKVGEVVVRGHNFFAGYVNRPDANAESFVNLPGSGVWFRTGDRGYLDEYGYLFLVGRLKELINRGGEKISPLELDDVFLSHPRVSEACTFGLPSEKYGEEVAAVCVLTAGPNDVTEKDLIEFISKRVSREKVPTRVFLMDSIPKNATGKMSRKFVSDFFKAKGGISAGTTNNKL